MFSRTARPLAFGTAPTQPMQNVWRESLSPNSLNSLSASNGSVLAVAPAGPTTSDTFAQAVEFPRMAPSSVLEDRRLNIRCIYKADAWAGHLRSAGLWDRYPYLVNGFRNGFIFDFPLISQTQSPPNNSSIDEFSDEFEKIVADELKKGRYIGPFSSADLISRIGPFQSSPFSIIPKSTPGKYRIIQNFSYPLRPSPSFPNPSINSFTSAADFPCTWGSFSVICQVLGRLPPGSQIAVRDGPEAFRGIPLHPSQWPAAVVRLRGSDQFGVDACGAFGARPTGGVYGNMQDGALDIFRSQGIGPVVHWVDDHVFIRILRAYLQQYNEQRATAAAAFSRNGPLRRGGRLWFSGATLPDGTVEESVEDCRFPLRDLSSSLIRSPDDRYVDLLFHTYRS